MLVTWEDLGNAASTSALVSNPASTPSFAISIMGQSALVTPYAGLRGVIESVVNCSVEKKGVVCGVIEWFGHWDQQCLEHHC